MSFKGQYWRGIIRTFQYWNNSCPFQGWRCPLQTTFLPQYDSSVHNAWHSTSVFWAWFGWHNRRYDEARNSLVFKRFIFSSFVYPTERALCRPLEALECLSSGSGIGRRLLEMLAVDTAEIYIMITCSFEFNHPFIAFSTGWSPSTHSRLSTELNITQLTWAWMSRIMIGITSFRPVPTARHSLTLGRSFGTGHSLPGASPLDPLVHIFNPSSCTHLSSQSSMLHLWVLLLFTFTSI